MESVKLFSFVKDAEKQQQQSSSNSSQASTILKRRSSSSNICVIKQASTNAPSSKSSSTVLISKKSPASLDANSRSARNSDGVNFNSPNSKFKVIKTSGEKVLSKNVVVGGTGSSSVLVTPSLRSQQHENVTAAPAGIVYTTKKMFRTIAPSTAKVVRQSIKLVGIKYAHPPPVETKSVSLTSQPSTISKNILSLKKSSTVSLIKPRSIQRAQEKGHTLNKATEDVVEEVVKRLPGVNNNRRKQVLTNIEDRDEKFRKDKEGTNEDGEDLRELEQFRENVKSAMKDLDWNERTGILEGFGSFRINEFGLLELTHSEIEQKSGRIKKKASSDVLLTCAKCSTHGLACEFYAGKYCSPQCSETSRQDKLRRVQSHEKRMKYRTVLVEEKKKLKKQMEVLAEAKFFAAREAVASRLSDVRLELAVIKCGIDWDNGDFGSWRRYFARIKKKSAPHILFKEAIPTVKNPFKVGTKLEAIDPVHPSLVCVASVVAVRGYRMKLHFDGYPSCHDFWVNASSPDIFYAGWCEKTENTLVPPKASYLAKMAPNLAVSFNWTDYLALTGAIPAAKNQFVHNQEKSLVPSGFRIGMKLEAVDKKNSRLTCVASISNVIDNRILVHFDGWSDIYDYWVDPTSPYIHPVGWCEQNGHHLMPPPEYKGTFNWDFYLHETNSQAAPPRAFKPRAPIEFRKGMKVEAVDKRNPELIRIATIRRVEGHQVQLRFDSWPNRYAFWTDDDSPDIHPLGWCYKTGHHLEQPTSLTELLQKRVRHSARDADNLISNLTECPIASCRGLGHALNMSSTHQSALVCPYAEINLKRDLSELLLSRFKTQEEIECVKAQGASKGTRPKYRIRKTLLPKIREKEKEKEKDKEKEKEKDREKKIKRVTIKKKRSEEANTPEEDSIEPEAKRSREAIDTEFIKSELNLSEKMEAVGPNPLAWSVEQVQLFVEGLDIPDAVEISHMMADELIDGESLLMLSRVDITNILKVKLGPAITLHSCISFLRNKAREWL